MSPGIQFQCTKLTINAGAVVVVIIW